jgi:hypothetical protein
VVSRQNSINDESIPAIGSTETIILSADPGATYGGGVEEL